VVNFINLPKSGNSNEAFDLPVSSSVVITGANGSGKTRLGAWMELESTQKDIVRRISAQKSLSMPDFSQTSAMEEAECDLKYGYPDTKQVKINPSHWKNNQRWGQKPFTFLLNDYQQLMVYLFTELFQKTLDHSEGKTTQNNSILHKIKSIWESVLPHRELTIEAGRIKSKISGHSAGHYNASEMSDGERVVFYLIGQCLTTDKNSILIIDEPELHLHRSIHSKLWTILESERGDCLFVYITHDLDFAAQKSSALKIWVKSYDGTNWDWRSLPEFEELPEDLVLEVLGARKSVIFVEGTANSFDLQLYSLFYADYLVLPRGSCESVIQTVKGLNESGIINDKKIIGIIDRDRRVDSEVLNLAKHSIHVLNVAEVENLFILPEIIKLVCETLEHSYEEKLIEIKAKVIDLLKNELDVQISKRASGEIRHRLHSFNDKSNGLVKIKSSYSSVLNSIDIDDIYEDVAKGFKAALASEDYLDVLRLYNRKSLLALVGEVLGLKKGEYVNLIKRMTNGKNREKLITALNDHLPNVSP
jgi:ABC-type lipoprotein export system ATPase subunit